MTDTERITNLIYDKHAYPEAYNLGILAAQCELMAHDPEHADQKPYLLLKAEDYRAAQAVELSKEH